MRFLEIVDLEPRAPALATANGNTDDDDCSKSHSGNSGDHCGSAN
jgi:hypothetical protein